MSKFIELETVLPKEMKLPACWRELIERQLDREYFSLLLEKIQRQKAQGLVVFPENKNIFSAFKYAAIKDIKVVILGQDPYHGLNQANGLAFSVGTTQKVPPSLKNIFKELARSIQGFNTPQHGDLSEWAEQGVLLLNTVLTVQQGKAHSHAKFGWEQFTDEVIRQINNENSQCVFMLWGTHAQSKGANIDRKKHLVLESVHPSPLSAYRGFLGCDHFLLANQWLQSRGMTQIDWSIKDNETLDLFSV